MSEERLPCLRCGVCPRVVRIDYDEYFASPQQLTKCKEYRRRRAQGVCKSEILPTEQGAISQWNRRFGQSEG